MIALTLTDDYPDDDFPPFGSGWFYILSALIRYFWIHW